MMRDQARNNVMCYSKTYGMNTPKDGMESMWDEAKAIANIINQMVDELPRRTYDSDLKRTQYIRKYIGHIICWRCKDESYIDLVEFAVAGIGDDNCGRDVRLFHIDERLGIGYLMSHRYEFECRERTDTTVTITVDSSGYIQTIDWSDVHEQQTD